ncbi:MAG TPA: GNAT family protein [Mesorhizobium sp.]|jgi:ribosomal-protein-alanine N-acetyltransferase
MFALPFFRRDLPVITGERVTLRPPNAGDYQQWAELRRESRAFLEPWEPRWTEDELDRTAWRQRLGRYREDLAQGSAIAFFIFHNTLGDLLGGITLGNIRHGVAQTGHIGYWMGERHAGKGYMVESVRLVTDYAFSTLHLHRVEAACIPGNERSIRVLEKAGFQREGLLRSYLRINGIWQDHHLFALVAGDPNGSSAKG